MKCNVCGTEIPKGEHICPSCGNRIKIAQHDIIKSQNHHHNKNAILLCGAILLIVIVYALIAKDTKPRASHTNKIERLTYQETIDRGYDDGSIQMAVELQKNVEDFVNKDLTLTEMKTGQYCLSDGHTTITCFYVGGVYQDVQYELSFSLANKKLSITSLNVYGTTNQSIQSLSQMPIDQITLNKMGSYLKIDNAYSLMNEARKKMEQKKDNQQKLFYSNEGNPEIVIGEIKESETEYNFDGSISIDYSKRNKK